MYNNSQLVLLLGKLFDLLGDISLIHFVLNMVSKNVVCKERYTLYNTYILHIYISICILKVTNQTHYSFSIFLLPKYWE